MGRYALAPRSNPSTATAAKSHTMAWLHIGDRLVDAYPSSHTRPVYTYHAWLPPNTAPVDAFSRLPRSASHGSPRPPLSYSDYLPHRPTHAPLLHSRAQHKHHVHLVDHEHPTCEFIPFVVCLNSRLFGVACQCLSLPRSYHTHEVIHRHFYPHYVSTETHHTHTRDGSNTRTTYPLSYGELAGTFVVDPHRSDELDAIRASSPFYQAQHSSPSRRAANIHHRSYYGPPSSSRRTKLPHYSYGYSTRRGFAPMHRPYH